MPGSESYPKCPGFQTYYKTIFIFNISHIVNDLDSKHQINECREICYRYGAAAALLTELTKTLVQILDMRFMYHNIYLISYNMTRKFIYMV